MEAHLIQEATHAFDGGGPKTSTFKVYANERPPSTRLNCLCWLSEYLCAAGGQMVSYGKSN